MPVWVAAARLPSVFAPTGWHIHEMLFGYLEAGPWLTAAFGMVVAAALARAAQEWLPGTGALWLAAVLWSGGFALFAVTIGPALARRRPGR